ncbi:hypothetical protein I4U23_011109 [Adineta vaga]|nr:hypothetical protein I4U23_011109 [Adineta vaga]
MASLMFDDNGRIRFGSRSNEYYKVQTTAAWTGIIPSFGITSPPVTCIGGVVLTSIGSEVSIPRFKGIAAGTICATDKLASEIVKVLESHDDYRYDIADEKLSDSECYHLLRKIGAHMDLFKNSPLKSYFDSDKRLFEKAIWNLIDLGKYVENIVKFCASYQAGYVNMTALTNTLSTLLNTEISEEHLSINKSETIIIYSEKAKECGVIKLKFTGSQIRTTYCFSQGSRTRINVEKDMIMFKDSRELWLSLQTFKKEQIFFNF